MKAFQQNLSRLEAADTQVLGVSIDSPFANHAFAQQIGVSFPLLGDVGGEVTRRYGLLTKIDVEGIPIETARRATFLIDKSGKIIEEQVDDKAINPAEVVSACERQKLKR
jgi:peroxiredoxin